MIGRLPRASPLFNALNKRRHHETAATSLINWIRRFHNSKTVSNKRKQGSYIFEIVVELMRLQHGHHILYVQVCLAITPHQYASPIIQHLRVLHSSSRKKQLTEVNVGSNSALDLDILSINLRGSGTLKPNSQDNTPLQTQFLLLDSPKLLRAKKTTVVSPSSPQQQHRDLPLSKRLMKLPHGSAHHFSLKTFLAHASNNKIDTTTSVFLGTRYEYLVSNALLRLGIRTKRIGKGGDRGVDLAGEWHLSTDTSAPSKLPTSILPPAQNLPPPTPLNVIVQCKRHTRALVPGFVRELEGAFAGAPAGWRRPSTVGLLVSPEAASPGVIRALQDSKRPIGYARVQESKDSMSARITQLTWNHRAEEVGLLGFGVNWSHRPGKTFDEDEESKEVVMTWIGWAIKDAAVNAASEAKLGDANQKKAKSKKSQVTKKEISKDDVKAKAGRPRKSSVQSEDETQGSSTASIDNYKKRGRPKKIQEKP